MLELMAAGKRRVEGCADCTVYSDIVVGVVVDEGPLACRHTRSSSCGSESFAFLLAGCARFPSLRAELAA